MKIYITLFLLLASIAGAANIRVETTTDFITYHIIRNDTLTITNGFVRLQIVGYELLVQQSEDRVSWANTRVRIPIARSVNPCEFFRLTILP